MPENRPHSSSLRKGRISEPGRIYFITTSCHGRRKYLNDPFNARIVMDEFELRAAEGACDNLAHVVMPDHIHWLVRLRGDSVLHEVVRRLKGRSARLINMMKTSPWIIWQKSFHDRALRAEEDIENIANYLIHNPLRAGLVRELCDYPYWWSVWHQRGRNRG